MLRDEDRAEHLLLPHEVVQVGAREAPGAGGAGARRVERAAVVREARVAEVEAPLAREGRSRARGARGQHAVEHVNAAGHGAHERGGVAHAHEVAGLLRRHVLGDERRERLEHRLVVLPHRVAADAKAREVADLGEVAQAAQAQVEVHAPLNDAKERLVRAGVGGIAALRPAARELHRALHLGPRRRVAHALVELHHDVRAELLRDGHVLLGRPGDPLSVVVHGAEAHAVVGEPAELLVAEHLEAAGVGEDGVVPAHKVVQAPHLGHEVGAGAHGEVVGVGEHDLGAERLERGGREPLDRGLGAHGHEDGGRDVAVRGVQDARARVSAGVLGEDVVGEEALVHVTPSWSACGPARRTRAARARRAPRGAAGRTIPELCGPSRPLGREVPGRGSSRLRNDVAGACVRAQSGNCARRGQTTAQHPILHKRPGAARAPGQTESVVRCL